MQKSFETEWSNKIIRFSGYEISLPFEKFPFWRNESRIKSISKKLGVSENVLVVQHPGSSEIRNFDKYLTANGNLTFAGNKAQRRRVALL